MMIKLITKLLVLIGPYKIRFIIEKELLKTVFCVVVVENGATLYICKNKKIAYNRLRGYALTYGMEESDLEIVEEEFYE